MTLTVCVFGHEPPGHKTPAFGGLLSHTGAVTVEVESLKEIVDPAGKNGLPAPAVTVKGKEEVLRMSWPEPLAPSLIRQSTPCFAGPVMSPVMGWTVVLPQVIVFWLQHSIFWR